MSDPQQIKVPLKYNMRSERIFKTPREKHIVSAYLDCPGLNEALITLCAELPRNWNWDENHGYVFLNVFNMNQTDDVRK